MPGRVMRTRWFCVLAVLAACGVGACSVPGPSVRADAGAAAMVSCHLGYGGETFHVKSASMPTAHDEAPFPVGSYFLFRIVFQNQPPEHAAIKLYTYADKATGPTLVHQARFPYPLAPHEHAAFGFTGLQTVHEPVRDGELQYWCEMAGAGPGADQHGALPAEPAPITHAASRREAGSVRLVFAGDLMLDDGPGRTIAAGGDPFAAVREVLRDADYTVGNLECPIATTGEALANKPWTFRAHPRVLNVLAPVFDAVSVANNHSGDYGQGAFVETLAQLQRAGIAAFGGGRNAREAHAPLWIERHGLRIALLGYNEFKPRSFEAGPTWPGIAWSEDSEVAGDIRAARAAGADVVIPFMHWGWEHEPRPDARQWALARMMIDAGADAVVGGHPHVTQGADLYRGRPIVWSLGNFVFDGFESRATTTGWLLRLTLDRNGVAAWDTLAARIDEAGTPAPAPEETTPCGRRGDQQVRACGGAVPR